MGFPKALLDLGEQTAIQRIVQTLGDGNLAGPLVVVTRAELVAALRDQLEGTALSAECVLANPDPDAGRTGTLQIGLEALRSVDASVVGCWVWPVDTPCATVETLHKLVAPNTGAPPRQRAAPQTYRRIPVFESRGGHPILLGRTWWSVITDRLRPDQPLRELYAIQPETVERIDVADPAVHWNLDDPVAVQTLLGRPARPRHAT